MRPAMLVGCLMLASAGAACSDSSAPVKSSPIVGAWIAPSESLHPNGSMIRQLGFSESGEFNYLANSYGIYPGQSAGTLSAYTHISGTYQIDGDRLTITGNRTATWDSFYGANSPERVDNVNTEVFKDARFRIVAGTLMLDYFIYPADAPVPTTESFTRLGLD